jgi:hypothetical protein
MGLICKICGKKISGYNWGISKNIGYHHQDCYPGGAGAYFEKEQEETTKEILAQFNIKHPKHTI